MSVRTWLAISLVANAALVGFTAIKQFQRDEVATSTSQAGPKPPAPAKVQQPITETAREKMVLLATLEAEARAGNPPPLTNFWSADADAQLDRYRSAVDQQEQAIRLALISRYGAGAEEDPLFSRLFRPLDVRFPYLTSKSQLALVKLQRDRAKTFPARTSQARNPPNADALRQRDREFDHAVQAALSSHEYDEYLLRESAVSRELRATGVFRSESEFRTALENARQFESDRSGAGYLAFQRGMRGLLGDERFLQFSAARDPAYQTVRDAAIVQHLQEGQTLSVYEAIMTAQLEVLEAQNDNAGNRAAAAMRIRDIVSRRDAQISSLVGTDPAQAILQAYSASLVPIGVRPEIKTF